MSTTTTNNYNSVASIYDLLANIYSGGQINAAKMDQIDDIPKGAKVLYAGVGSAEDAISAAKKGANVTIIDLSQSMLDQAEKKIASIPEDLKIKLVCSDILTFGSNGQFDIVVANFFLNCFKPVFMKKVFTHLVSLIPSGGKIFIADFAPLKGNQLGKLAQWGHWALAVGFFKLTANSPYHPLYDYESYFFSLGLQTVKSKDFRIGGIGPAWYQTIIANKK